MTCCEPSTGIAPAPVTPVYSHGRPTVRGTRGMVTSAHPLATLAGLRMLDQGGNAFDAIAATAAALNVVEPYMSGLAGLGMAVVYTAHDAKIRSLDFHPQVPMAFDANDVTKAETVTGAKASGVPGNLAGWCFLTRELGVLSLDEVFAPAIGYAEDGVATTRFFREMTATGESRAMRPEWHSTYVAPTDGGAQGVVLRQPELARTMRAVATDGPEHLYDGPLGRAMVEHMQSLGGILTLDDLAAVKPIWEEPVTTTFGGLDIHVPPPPASSFQFLLTLAILEQTGLDGAAHLSTDHLDRVFRAIRLAAECRIENADCDADGARALLDVNSVTRLAERIADPTVLHGRTEGYGDGPPEGLTAMREHTTSFSAVDSQGNAVCLTQSLGSPYGSGVVIPGTGVCMNNFMNWGDLNPASPNFLRGGQRFGMCLAPSLSLTDGELVLALGTPGSYGILQTQAQALVHRQIYGLELQAAIDAPRGRLWDDAKVDLENRIEPTVVAALRDRGHEINQVDPFSMLCGGMHAIERDPATGVLGGAADSRRDGAAMAL